MVDAKTVIFDFDGTLANSVDLIIDLYNEHAELYGYERIAKEEIPEIRRLGYKKAMKKKKIRFRIVPKMVADLGRKMRMRMHEVKPFDDIVPLLIDLRQSGYRLGVLTSNQVSLVTDFLENHNFPPFDFVVSEKTLFGKGKALKKIMRQQKLHPDEVVYVGDEPRDVVASRKAKVAVVGVSWGLGGEEGFEKATPDKLVHSTQELKDAISQLI